MRGGANDVAIGVAQRNGVSPRGIEGHGKSVTRGERARFACAILQAHPFPGCRWRAFTQRTDRELHARTGRRERAEQRQTCQQRALASEPVAEATCGKQQAGEHEGVGVDDPLQAARAGVQLARERGQGHVHDRVVHDDHEQRDAEHGEDLPASRVRTGALRDRFHRSDLGRGHRGSSFRSVTSEWSLPLRSKKRESPGRPAGLTASPPSGPSDPGPTVAARGRAPSPRRRSSASPSRRSDGRPQPVRPRPRPRTSQAA